MKYFKLNVYLKNRYLVDKKLYLAILARNRLDPKLKKHPGPS